MNFEVTREQQFFAVNSEDTGDYYTIPAILVELEELSAYVVVAHHASANTTSQTFTLTGLTSALTALGTVAGHLISSEGTTNYATYTFDTNHVDDDL